MGNKMLIDATHPEETRVVVTRGNRVEEFDYESAARKQLRGNIYLAKIARIEPSLQAAFVNYGGNRHGFLAFAEIHSDYYQIPVAVREALKKEEALDRQNRNHDNGERGSDDRTEGNRSGPADNGGGRDTQSKDGFAASEQDAAQQGAEVSVEPGHETANELASGAEQSPTDHHENEQSSSPMALEAALPPTLYAEFKSAVELGESVRDEIPSHPDDVETQSEHSTGEAIADHGAAGPGTEQQPAESNAGEQAPAAPQEEPHSWETQSRSEEGGVISVPEPQTPVSVEVVGSEDALEELPQRHKRRWRNYKIQEVIKRNQIVLVQVVKEERGTKGAALTTYLSLAGRYTVLMPNTPSGGGISRKITVPADRKRLKEIAEELEVPEGMGLIIRTAGASRTKAEIKRDFEYLLRLWENVRDLTLKSTAPCLVYEEGDLIKRSIRDLYNKDIDEILVAGENAYRDAKDFMRMLMPSHAKNVQLYKEPEPLFIKYEVERQLNQMFSPVVTLRSGGYIVLNQTEALVAIDVNSGRATREYSIEDTALKTNLEAAEEVARQVRLRDLAGLIVIDFIDMDERRNNRSVERRLKECLRHDRARIQVGHISHFGLLEMSRQRLRQGVVEVSTMPCPVCQGVGHIRSTESVALMILRAIEDNLRTQGPANITASAAPEAALYILNHKRTYLRDIEFRYAVTIVVQTDASAHGSNFTLERAAEATMPVEAVQVAIQPQSVQSEAEEEDEEAPAASEADDKRSPRRKRRRRRGRGGDQPLEQGFQNGASVSAFESDEDAADDEEEIEEAPSEAAASEQHPAEAEGRGPDEDRENGFRKNRRRGRRGGRRHRGDPVGGPESSPYQGNGHIAGLGEQPIVDFDRHFSLSPPPSPVVEIAAADSTLAERSEPVVSAPLLASGEEAEAAMPVLEALKHTEPQSEAAPVPSEPDEAKAQPSETPVLTEEKPAPTPVQQAPKPVRTGPPRKGWWQRRVGE
jgi:ribonuclease E